MLMCYRVGSRGDRRYRREDVLRFMQHPGHHLQTNVAEENVPLSHPTGRPSSPSEEMQHSKRRGAKRNKRHPAASVQPLNRKS